MAAFEDLCNQVTGEVLENVNHLARGTRTILKTTELTNVPALIGKKNFTLTSDNHLAALFIKIIQCYVNVTFTKSDESKTQDAIKKEKLSKYIWQLQKRQFKESTKKNISEQFKAQCSNFFELIDEPKKFKNILIKAAKLTQTIKLNTNTPTKLERKRNEIDEIIAEATDYTTDLSAIEKTLLSAILKKIKNTCKDPHNDETLKNDLSTILTNPPIPHGNVDSPEWGRIRNEVASLKHVNDNYDKQDLAKTFKEQLKHCHKETIEQLFKAKERIVNAYTHIAQDAKNTKEEQGQESSSSSSFESSNDGKTKKSSTSSTSSSSSSSGEPQTPAKATGRKPPKDPPPKAPTKPSGKPIPTQDRLPENNPRPKTDSKILPNASKTAKRTTSAVPPAQQRTKPTRDKPAHTTATKVPPPPNYPAPTTPDRSTKTPKEDPKTAEQRFDIPPDMPALKPINLPKASQKEVQAKATQRKASGPRPNKTKRTRPSIPKHNLPPTPVTSTQDQSSEKPAPKQGGHTVAKTTPGGRKTYKRTPYRRNYTPLNNTTAATAGRK